MPLSSRPLFTALVFSGALAHAACPSVSLAASVAWTANGVPVAPADSTQLKPRVVPDNAGGATIVWRDKRGGPFLAYAQHLAEDGSIAPGWPATGVLIPNRGPSQNNLTVIDDGAGGAYIASDDDGYVGVVMVYHLGHDGLPAPGWPSEAVTLQKASYGVPGGSQGAFLPALFADDSGGVFVARTYRDRLYQSIALTRLTASAGFAPGWSSGANAGAGGPWEYASLLCSDGRGGVYVAFQENHIPPRILFDRFDGLGNRLFAGNTVSPAPLDQIAPGLVSDAGTGAIVVWEDHRNGIFDQVFAQRILSDGSVAPGWPATGLAVCVYPTAPGMPSDFIFPGPLSSIEPDGTGGAYVAWADYRDSTGTGDGDIFAQHVLGDGTLAPGWPVDGLAVCRVPGDQELPTLAPDHAGGVFVTWQDRRGGSDYDVYLQRITSGGVIASGWPVNGLALCTASGDQTAPVAAAHSAGDLIVAWTDGRSSIPQIFATRVVSDAVATVDVPKQLVFALRCVAPNPGAGRLRASFTLATRESATLDVLDVSGRRLQWFDVGSLGPGVHEIEINRGRALAPGLYVIRLTQGARSARFKAIVVK